MSASGDFIPGDTTIRGDANYPVVFGITLTPPISGLLLALLGVGGAAYLFLNLVQPEWQRYQELSTRVQDKTAQLEQQAAIQQQIKKAEEELAKAKKQREDVLTLFANESTLRTLLLDLNRQVAARNAGLDQARQQKLAACPAWVRNNVEEVEEQAGDLVVRAQMRKFQPDTKLSGIIADGSYGTLVDNKLKRQAVDVVFEGNFNQTQSILRSIERLQPLLVFKNLNFALGGGEGGKKSVRLFEIRGNTARFLSNCQPEPKITSTFRLEALLPLTSEEMAAANPAPNKAAPQ
jgi:type IV pilus assembly protein PilO